MNVLRLSVLASMGLLFACAQGNNFKGEARQGIVAAPTPAPAPASGPPSTAGNALPDPLPAPAVPLPLPVPTPIPEPETKEIFRDCDLSQSSKFVAKLYKLPENTQNLPDFPSLSPLKEVCLKQLDIAHRSFEEGFPGVDNLIEWFALDIYFDVKIEKEGDYTFRLNSDDGSRLKVDGNVLIDNDGLHGVISKEAVLHLTAGVHKFNLAYFQGPRFNIALELFWKATGGNEGYLPLEMVSRPK